MHNPIAYTYEADWHCPACTMARFGDPIPDDATDDEGNEIGAVFSWDEWWEPSDNETQTLNCGDCHDELAVVEAKATDEYADESSQELVNQAIDRVEEVLRRNKWNQGYNNHPTVRKLKTLLKWVSP